MFDFLFLFFSEKNKIKFQLNSALFLFFKILRHSTLFQVCVIYILPVYMSSFSLTLSNKLITLKSILLLLDP